MVFNTDLEFNWKISTLKGEVEVHFPSIYTMYIHPGRAEINWIGRGKARGGRVCNDGAKRDRTQMLEIS